MIAQNRGTIFSVDTRVPDSRFRFKNLFDHLISSVIFSRRADINPSKGIGKRSRLHCEIIGSINLIYT
jgi:hypothetical protein